MTNEENENEERPTTRRRRVSGDGGAKEVQKKMNEINEKGYVGNVPDKTPNSAYTLHGVQSGEPTPETTPPEDRQD